MIVLHIRVLTLLILQTITNQHLAQPNHGTRIPIDWTKCNDETKCFCLMQSQKLIEVKSDEQIKQVNEDPSNCNIGAQNKFFSGDISVLYMQVTGLQKPLETNPELVLYLEPAQELFGCKLDSKTNKVQLVGDKNNNKQFKIDLFEDRSRFEKGYILCAIQIKRTAALYGMLNDWSSGWPNVDPKIPLPKLKYTQSDEFKFNGAKLAEIVDMTRTGKKCNPFTFKEISTSSGYIVKPVKNKDRDTLNCEEYGPLFEMRYQLNSPNGNGIKELKCVKENNKFLFKIIKKEKDAAGKHLEEPISNLNLYMYTFYCAANFNKLCKDPRDESCKQTPSPPSCPDYKLGTADQPATLECPNKKWLIGEEYYEQNMNNPYCAKDVLIDANSAVFFFKLPSGNTKRLEKAECFNDYDCKVKSKKLINVVPCDGSDPKCGDVDFSNGMMKCKNPTHKFRIHYYAKNQTLDATDYTCDTSTGIWRNATGATIEDESRVSCVGDETPETKEQKASLSQTVFYLILGAIVIVVVVVASAATYCVVKCYMRRHLIKGKDEKEWKKLSKEEQFEHCEKFFKQMLHTTESEENEPFSFGFKQLQLMLKTNVEGPRAWEAVYPFLVRFQIAIEKLDYNLWHMFSRFMYLEAKKILDKHGWLTDKPIRKNQQNGLIRVVAIHMLSFALYDDTNEDAEDLIILGFRKLGFTNASSQYPHCGLMWSVILHARALRYRKKADTKITRVFNNKKYLATLKAVALQMKIPGIPADEVIPEFGNISHQGAFALGSSPSHNFNTSNGSKILTGPNLDGIVADIGVSTSFFKGLIHSLSRGPTEEILYSCKMFKDPNPKLLANLHKVAPESVWNELIEKACQVLISYGRSVDVERLMERFLTKKKEEIDQEVIQLKLEYGQFVLKVRSQKEELRTWFADNTEVPQHLKEKPVYVTGRKGRKMDARVVADGAKDDAPKPETDAAAPVPAGTASNSDSSAASTPKDAAPAAVPTPNPAEPAPNPAEPAPNAAPPIPNSAAPTA